MKQTSRRKFNAINPNRFRNWASRLCPSEGKAGWPLIGCCVPQQSCPWHMPQKKPSILYYLRTRLSERANRNLKEMIASFMGDESAYWDRNIYEFWFAIISTSYEVPGLTPAELNLGRALAGSQWREYYTCIDLVIFQVARTEQWRNTLKVADIPVIVRILGLGERKGDTVSGLGDLEESALHIPKNSTVCLMSRKNLQLA